MREFFARIGRIFQDDNGEHGLALWVIAGGVVVLVLWGLKIAS